MAMTQQQRDERMTEKRRKAGEEELRFRVRAGTKQALAELMAWAEIEEQGEALTLMIHHLHALGPAGSRQFIEPPRHNLDISESVALRFYQQSLMMIRRDPGDEIVAPHKVSRTGNGRKNSGLIPSGYPRPVE